MVFPKFKTEKGWEYVEVVLDDLDFPGFVFLVCDSLVMVNWLDQSFKIDVVKRNICGWKAFGYS